MKKYRYKTVTSNNVGKLVDNNLNWHNKYCANGTVCVEGLRKRPEWKEAFIVLCKGTFYSVTEQLFSNL